MIDSTCVRVHQHGATGKMGDPVIAACDVPEAASPARSMPSLTLTIVPSPCRPGRIVLTTIAEALSIAAAGLLDVDAADIGGGHRAALNEGGARGSEVEVFLYDTAPGGAGFVRAAARDGTR